MCARVRHLRMLNVCVQARVFVRARHLRKLNAEAEISYLYVAPAVNEDVVGFDVSVNAPV